MAIAFASPAYFRVLEGKGGRGFISCCTSPAPSKSGARTITKNWKSFSKNVSGEWSGTGVEFDSSGKALAIPSELVPAAYNEWGVKLYDWDTYSATRAEKKTQSFYNKTMRLYPKAGCDATTVTIYKTEEHLLDDTGNSSLAFDESGGFLAVWKNQKVVEHCLMDDSLSTVRTRVRVLHELDGFEPGSGVGKITVFREQWEDDFQSGKTVESCLTLHAGLSTGYRLTEGDVRGVWQVFRSSFSHADGCGCVNEMAPEQPSSFMMEREFEVVSRYVCLPQNFWSVVKNVGEELEVEAGWLITPALAVASRCRLSSSGEVRKAELETQLRTSKICKTLRTYYLEPHPYYSAG